MEGDISQASARFRCKCIKQRTEGDGQETALARAAIRTLHRFRAPAFAAVVDSEPVALDETASSTSAHGTNTTGVTATMLITAVEITVRRDTKLR